MLKKIRYAIPVSLGLITLLYWGVLLAFVEFPPPSKYATFHDKKYDYSMEFHKNWDKYSRLGSQGDYQRVTFVKSARSSKRTIVHVKFKRYTNPTVFNINDWIKGLTYQDKDEARQFSEVKLTKYPDLQMLEGEYLVECERGTLVIQQKFVLKEDGIISIRLEASEAVIDEAIVSFDEIIASLQLTE